MLVANDALVMAQIMGVSSSSSPFRPAAAADLTYPFPFALFFALVFLGGRNPSQGRNPTHQGWQSRHLAQGGLQRGCQERQCPSFLNLTCTTHAIDLCSETLSRVSPDHACAFTVSRVSQPLGIP